MAIYNPYYQNPNYNGTGTYPLSYQNTSQLQNVIDGNMLDGFISKYLDEHSYKPYIPRKERKNE